MSDEWHNIFDKWTLYLLKQNLQFNFVTNSSVVLKILIFNDNYIFNTPNLQILVCIRDIHVHNNLTLKHVTHHLIDWEQIQFDVDWRGSRRSDIFIVRGPKNGVVNISCSGAVELAIWLYKKEVSSENCIQGNILLWNPHYIVAEQTLLICRKFSKEQEVITIEKIPQKNSQKRTKTDFFRRFILENMTSFFIWKSLRIISTS